MALTEAQKAAQRRYREKNRERRNANARQKAAERRADPERRAEYNESMRQWRAAHPAASRETTRAWRDRNPYQRVRNHGITVEQYCQMIEAQEGRCAICGEVPEQRLRVDHDHACCAAKHSCGECVRGLLCGTCNAALGGFRDDPRLLEAALKYLRKWERSGREQP
jgi:hypothetical protein